MSVWGKQDEHISHSLYHTLKYCPAINTLLCCITCMKNRQARAALGDRMKYSLQLTALRLKPSRLLGVQALTLHNP